MLNTIHIGFGLRSWFLVLSLSAFAAGGAWAGDPASRIPMSQASGRGSWSIMFEPDEDTLLGIRSGVNDFGDSHQVAMELQYRMAQPWQFFLAIAYDSPVGERDGGADPAAGHRSRLGAGIRYRWSKTLNLAFVYETADPEKTVSGLQRDETSKDSPDSPGLIHFATFSATLEF